MARRTSRSTTRNVSPDKARGIVFLFAALMALVLSCPVEGGSLASFAFAAEPIPAIVGDGYEGDQAAEGAAEGAVEQTAEGQAAAETLRLRLSDPAISDAPDGGTRYTTTLTVEGVSAFYGYQIQVAAPTEDGVTLNNLVSGTVTEAVYREGSLFLAVLASEEMSGDLVICEIVSDFAPGDTERERSITVTKLEVVTSIASETLLALGPDPAAVVLALPSTEPLRLPLWVMALIAAVMLLALALGVALLIRRRRLRRAQHSHSRQPHGHLPSTQRTPGHLRLGPG